MVTFKTSRIPVVFDSISSFGAEVRSLLSIENSSLSLMELPSGFTTDPVYNNNIDEIWYIVGGRGELWRKQGSEEKIVPLDTGVCVTIPRKVHFQVRTYGFQPLSLLVVSTPIMQGDYDAERVKGIWQPTRTSR